jgi:hypothetical protein
VARARSSRGTPRPIVRFAWFRIVAVDPLASSSLLWTAFPKQGTLAVGIGLCRVNAHRIRGGFTLPRAMQPSRRQSVVAKPPPLSLATPKGGAIPYARTPLAACNVMADAPATRGPATAERRTLRRASGVGLVGAWEGKSSLGYETVRREVDIRRELQYTERSSSTPRAPSPLRSAPSSTPRPLSPYAASSRRSASPRRWYD